MESRLVQEGLMDYCGWALKPIYIVSDFKSLIAFLVQKLLGCELHTVWVWTTVTHPAYFSEEGWNAYRAHAAGNLSCFDPNLSDGCMPVFLPLNTLCYFFFSKCPEKFFCHLQSALLCLSTQRATHFKSKQPCTIDPPHTLFHFVL